jgi:hypothetical protein
MPATPPLPPPAPGAVSSTNAEVGNRMAAGGEFGAVHSIRNRCARQAEEIDADLDMTPMIDVVFQLLIFFMVASSISVMGQLSLPPAVTGDTEDVRERVTLVLDLPPSMLASLPERGGATMFLSEAVLYFNDEPDRKLAGADLRQELRSKFAAHRAQRESSRSQSSSSNSDSATADNSTANASNAGAVQLILMAHRRAPVRLVRQVLAMAREEGAGEALVGVATRMGAPTGGGSP